MFNKRKKKHFSQKMANLLCSPDQPSKSRFLDGEIKLIEGVAYDDAFRTVSLDVALKGKEAREE